MLQQEAVKFGSAGIWPFIGAGVSIAGIEASVIETCHTLWIFDQERMRFQRVPREVGVENAPADWQRVNELAVQARAGTLTAEERAELDEYERSTCLVELMQSKARLSLKRAGLSP